MARGLGLSRERIVDGAARVADDGGLVAVSMRNVAKELGVEAMSLYHHMRNKDDLLDALTEWTFEKIQLPEPDEDWRPAMERRARSAREVLSAHSWAFSLIESRKQPGPAQLGHHNAILGSLRQGGFDVALAAHAFSLIDSYVYGFVLTEVTLPSDDQMGPAEFVAQITHSLDDYPWFAEIIAHSVSGGEYHYGDEFDIGLAMILDQLEHQLGAR